MRIRFKLGMCLLLSMLTLSGVFAQSIDLKQYHTPEEIVKISRELVKANSKIASMEVLTNTPGGFEIPVIQVGDQTGAQPAVLVMANIEGNVPISSEAALYLLQEVISNQNYRNNLSWYIIPVGNPDAASRYFSSVKYECIKNLRDRNEDLDENTNEDDVDDLNGDGFITQMRYESPDGNWLIAEDNPMLMRKANVEKGEKGKYKIVTEGLDNDGDGKINEDGAGGVMVNRNFPHMFEEFKIHSGPFSGSEVETYAIMKWVYQHPEIAMTISLGNTNFLLFPPEGGRKGSADYTSIKIPDRIANRFGVDNSKTYTMDEIIEMMQPMVPAGVELTPGMVASFLGLGAAVNPLDGDLKFYGEISEQFKEYLEEQKVSTNRYRPAKAANGSFELWSYFHLGVPTFSMDFWTIPKAEKNESGDELTAESIGKMSDEEFVALGADKIDAFLRSIGAPDQYTGEMVVKMVEAGNLNTERISKMLAQMGGGNAKKEAGKVDEKTSAKFDFSKTYLDGNGFVEWKSYNHPMYGKVEIGGEIPYLETTPPVEMMDTLIKKQLPYVFQLTNKLARLKIEKFEVKDLGSGVGKLTIWVSNTAYLPFPTEMGERNGQPAPAILQVKGQNIEFLSGKPRTPVGTIGGNKSKKFEYIVHSKNKQSITIQLDSKNAWGDSTTLTIGG